MDYTPHVNMVSAEELKAIELVAKLTDTFVELESCDCGVICYNSGDDTLSITDAIAKMQSIPGSSFITYDSAISIINDDSTASIRGFWHDADTWKRSFWSDRGERFSLILIKRYKSIDTER